MGIILHHRSAYLRAYDIVTQAVSTDVNSPTYFRFGMVDAANEITVGGTNNTEITVGRDGTYSITAQPQMGKSVGGIIRAYQFIEADYGSGFTALPDTASFLGLQGGIDSPTAQDVLVTSISLRLLRGNKLRFAAVADAAGSEAQFFDSDIDLGLDIPDVPSVTLSIIWHGY